MFTHKNSHDICHGGAGQDRLHFTTSKQCIPVLKKTHSAEAQSLF
jgi:hypothetical protein